MSELEEAGFATWEMFEVYSTFVSIVFAWVAFTKEWKYIKKIPTRIYSFLIAFALMVIVNIHSGQFYVWDMFLYATTSLMVSLTSNGLAMVDKNLKTNTTEVE